MGEVARPRLKRIASNVCCYHRLSCLFGLGDKKKPRMLSSLSWVSSCRYVWKARRGLGEEFSLSGFLVFVCFLRLLECAMLRWHLDFRSLEQFSNGAYLDTRIFLVPAGGVVVACADGLGYHISARRFQRDEDADSGVLALHGANQVADIAGFDVTGFDLHQHALRFSVGVVDEGDNAIDASVAALFSRFAAFLTTERFGLHKGERPPLELIAVILRELFCGGHISWFADNVELDIWEHISQAVFLQGNTQVGDVYAYPFASKLLRGGDGGATATEGIKYDVSRVTAGLDDTL